MTSIELQAGTICPMCQDRKRKGILIIKYGRFGNFLSCCNFPACRFSSGIPENLEAQASKLLKAVVPKIRRGQKQKVHGA